MTGRPRSSLRLRSRRKATSSMIQHPLSITTSSISSCLRSLALPGDLHISFHVSGGRVGSSFRAHSFVSMCWCKKGRRGRGGIGSPARIERKMNGVHGEEKENGPIQAVLPVQPQLRVASDPSPVGGIESFLEREEIRTTDLPVDAIGLSPATPRGPSPSPASRDPSPLPGNPIRVPHSTPQDEHLPNPESGPSEVVAVEKSVEEEEDDDFGDFGEAPPPVEDVESKVESGSVDDDEWNAFESSSATAQKTESKSDEDDDWAALESVEGRSEVVEERTGVPPPFPLFHPPSTPTSPSLKDLVRDEEMWECEAEDLDESAFDLFTVLDNEEEGQGGDFDVFRQSRSLWLALRVVEEATALKYEWASSDASKRLFRVLNINPKQSSGRIHPSVPTTNSVLVPTPITQSNGKPRTVTLSACSSSISHVPSSPLSPSPLSPSPLPPSSPSQPPPSFSPSQPPPSFSPSQPPPSFSQPSSSNSKAAVVDSLAAPPAEFDWEKSTLKNPLTPQAMSAMLDIDFLAGGKNGGPPKMISSDTTLQKDMEAFGLSTTVTSGGMPSVKASTTSVLDSLLSSTSSSSPPFLRPSELSLDARALHDALPSLDYLSNSWISFPVRDPSE